MLSAYSGWVLLMSCKQSDETRQSYNHFLITFRQSYLITITLGVFLTYLVHRTTESQVNAN